MDQNKHYLWLASIFLPAAFFSYIISFYYLFSRELTHDWDYFNSASLLVKSLVLHYGIFPVHDPWVGGGLDLLANPQSRVFSPMVILDLLFYPNTANILSLFIYALFGMFGMYFLLRRHGISQHCSIVFSIVFVNAGWFGLHYSEGHIAYGVMQTMPWMLYSFVRIREKNYQLLLVALFSLYLVDGGIYAFIFSTAMLFVYALSNIDKSVAVYLHKNALVSLAKKHAKRCLALGMAFLCIVSCKIVPVLLLIRSRKPDLGYERLDFSFLLELFFNPLQYVGKKTPAIMEWGFHEYGCYLGIISVVLIIAIWFTSAEFRRENKRLIINFLFWFWVGSGWMTTLNPWHLFGKAPLFNNAHIQSRTFIIMYLFFIIILGKAVDKLRPCKKTTALLALLLIESFFVKNCPFWHNYQNFSKPLSYKQLIDKTNLRKTLKRGEKPSLYYEKGRCFKKAYEPAAVDTQVMAYGDTHYRGEAYFSSGKGDVEISEYTPGSITLAYKMYTDIGKITINTNALLGWKVKTGPARMANNAGSLVIIQPSEKQGTVKLKYHPRYLKYMIIAYVTGILILIYLLLYFRKKNMENRL